MSLVQHFADLSIWLSGYANIKRYVQSIFPLIYYFIFIFLSLLLDCEQVTVLVVLMIFSLVVKSNTAFALPSQERQFYGGSDRWTQEGMLGNPLSEALPQAHWRFCLQRVIPWLLFKHIMLISTYGRCSVGSSLRSGLFVVIFHFEKQKRAKLWQMERQIVP